MKRSTLYKLGGGAVIAIILIIILVTCTGGGFRVSFNSTSTCADWSTDVSADPGYLQTYVQNDASIAGMSTGTYVSQVSAYCAANPGSNLSGVLSAATLGALGG